MDIYTIVYNNADFLELQYLSFREHCPYFQGFIVVDNSPNEHTRQGIQQFASKYGCPVLRTTAPRFDNAGFSHQQAIQTVLDHMQGCTLICDPDVFPLRWPNLGADDCVFAGLMQGTETVRYVWPGFMYINAHMLQDKLDLRGALVNPLNFDDYIIADTLQGWSWDSYPAQIKTHTPTDSGGLLCRYIQKHSPKIHELSLAFMGDMCYDSSVMPEHLRGLYKELYNFWVIGGCILHSGRLSNWDNRPNDEVAAKSELVRELVRYFL